MMLLLIVVLLVLAFGGFGHTGYRRGWYGGYARSEPARGGWLGGGLGLFLLIVVLLLLFAGPHNYYSY